MGSHSSTCNKIVQVTYNSDVSFMSFPFFSHLFNTFLWGLLAYFLKFPLTFFTREKWGRDLTIWCRQFENNLLAQLLIWVNHLGNVDVLNFKAFFLRLVVFLSGGEAFFVFFFYLCFQWRANILKQLIQQLEQSAGKQSVPYLLFSLLFLFFFLTENFTIPRALRSGGFRKLVLKRRSIDFKGLNLCEDRSGSSSSSTRGVVSCYLLLPSCCCCSPSA